MPLAPTPLLSVTSSEGLAIIVLILFVLGVLAALWGVGVFVMRQFDNRMTRVAVGIGLGVVTGWLIADNSVLTQRPEISWVSAIAFTIIFGALGAVWRLRRSGSATRTIETPVIGSAVHISRRIADSLQQPNLVQRALPGALTGAFIQT